MFRSLTLKWIATLLLTSLIGVVLVGVFAYRTTVTEFDRLRSDQAEALFVQNVTSYYQATESWAGIEGWLRTEPGIASPQRWFQPPQWFALVDMNGIVVAGRGPLNTGDQIPAAMMEAGIPITIDGKQVGTALLAQMPPALDPREQRYMDGANRALLVGALGASATALVVGILLSRQFLRPLSELTRAITAMRAGNLDQRVQIRTRDELGILAQTFNEMSANLYHAIQHRKQMTADIAHDLRTPLTVIGGYLEALRDGTLKPTPERFSVMSDEVRLLQRLVEDLRTLSLADAGELKLLRAPVNPRELLERVAVSFEESAATAGITLCVKTADDLSDILIDQERMVQVLGNLVSNALRHTPRGGTVTLQAQTTAGGVQLMVSDTGSGIRPEDLPKVFNRFYRSDPSRQSDSGESGLGLAIVKSIVEAHGGTIAAQSQLEAGTTMLITLPRPPGAP